MAGLADFRSQHPEYDDMSDKDLGDALYRKFYSDVPRADFDQKMGINAAPTTDKSWSGSILPFSSGPNGKVQFDPNAGLVGAAIGAGKAAISGAALPGDVYSGKVNPNSDQAIQRSWQLAGVVAPVNPAVRAGDAAIAGSGRLFPRAPANDQLKAAGSVGFNKARDMGVAYTPESVVRSASETQVALEQEGFSAGLAPDTFDVLRDLQSPPTDPTAIATYTGVDTARKRLNKVIQSNADNPTDQLAARRVIAELDKFVEKPDPADVVAGPASEVGAVSKDARGNWAAGSRGETLAAIAKRSQLRADSTGSGANLDNAIRQNVVSFIRPGPNGEPSRAKISGFTDSEIALLEKIAGGSVTTDALRKLGNLLGGGGGLGAAAVGTAGGVIGTATGGPVAGAMLGIGGPAIGMGLKMGENALARRALNNVSETIRKRSPLYRDNPPNVPPSPAQRAAIIRSLLLGIPKPQRDTTGKPIPAGTQIY